MKSYNGMTLDEQQRRAIIFALGELPYGGLVMHRFPREASDAGRFVEQLVDTLKGFAVELRKMSEQRERERDELCALQLQQQQTRRFLGLDQLQSSIEQLQLDVASAREGS